VDSSKQPVGIAVIGAGLMGRQHTSSAMACPDVELIGVTAVDARQAHELAAKHGTTDLGSVEAALADDRVEAVIIATPTNTHDELAAAALSAGKHAFVEKPVTRTLEAALELRALARSHDRMLGVGHVIRYFAEYRKIAATLEAGGIGTPAVATLGRRCQQPDWAPDKWHTDMARSGGVAIDMMIHDVDLVRWYFGEPTQVYARVIGSDKHDGLDYALATLTVPGGPICHLHGSWAEPEGFSQSAEIAGSMGMIDYDSRGRGELQLMAHAGTENATALPPPPTGPQDPFQRQLSDFAAAIRTGSTFPGDIDWAIGSLRIALAMVESSDTRDVVNISSLEHFFASQDANLTTAGGVA